MRAVVQRVSRASVTVDGSVVGEIELGVLVLAGVEKGDTKSDVDYVANKIAGLRIFPDENDKMNLSLAEINGSVLVVSQFTLLGDVRKGRRPSFVNAADPETGSRLYLLLAERFRELRLPVATGTFQADMKVELLNDGPVTILIDSKRTF